MSALKIGGLFEGYGGLTMGVQAALGGELAWYSEIDKGALKILKHRHPDVPNIGDITKVDWSQVEPVDILTGGSPCQDLSHAGKRAGMTEGTRSNLWVAMREAIAQLRPGLVIWENVRGANSAEADSDLANRPGLLDGVRRRDGQPLLRALGRVLGDLSELGYVGGWHGLRAADIGAPHGRFRYFVVAADTQRGGRNGWAFDQIRGPLERTTATRSSKGVGSLFKTPTSQLAINGGSQHPDKRKSGGHGPTLADEVEHLLPSHQPGRDRLVDGQEDATHVLLPTPAVNDMGAGKTVDDWDAWTDRMKAEHGNGNGHGKSLSIEAQRLAMDDPTPVDPSGNRVYECMCSPGEPRACPVDHSKSARLLPTPMVGDAASACNSTATRHKLPPTGVHAGDTLTDIIRGAREWGDYAPAIARWEQILERPAPEPTQVSRKGNPQLSAKFVEWLMGLPDGWVTDVPDLTRNEMLKVLGNGVVTQQAEAGVRFLLPRIQAAA